MRRTIILGLLAASMMSAAPGIARASASDAWITTKAKMTLLTTEGVGSSTIDVEPIPSRMDEWMDLLCCVISILPRSER